MHGFQGLTIPKTPFDHIKKGALKASQEVLSGGKQIKMILKQYHITGVSFSGLLWFKKNGELVKNGCYKYRIIYEDDQNNEFTWCFN